MNPSGEKHFLDSTVVRDLLTSTSQHKRYLNSKLTGRQYCSEFVKMEIRRSLLSALINFYFLLQGPDIENFSDAVRLWRNKFKRSEHNAVETLIAALLENRDIDMITFRDKPKALQEIARYILRLQGKISGFPDPGPNHVDCSRAKVSFDNARMENIDQDFDRFLSDFDNTSRHESSCGVRKFLLSSNRQAIGQYVLNGESRPQPLSESRGFVTLTSKLKQITEKGGANCSCRMCGSIGDAVIALDAPRDQQLEHTDRSFNYLCPPIKQPHRLLDAALTHHADHTNESADDV